MATEFEKIAIARGVLQKIAKGMNPLSGEPIVGDSFLSNPKMVRCFLFVDEVLNNVLTGVYATRKLNEFIITPDEKSRVKFPEGCIGVNEFARCINSVIDLSRSKRLSGTEVNKHLKKMGILSEISQENGRTRTVTNARSSEYGFAMETKVFNEEEYEMVVMNDYGKHYLLEKIDDIMKETEGAN